MTSRPYIIDLRKISKRRINTECSDQVSQDRLALVEYHTSIASHISDPDFINYAKKNAAHMIAYKLLEDGFIKFYKGPNNLNDLTFELRATIGVVAPKQVVTIEERVTQHQEELAKEVVEEAIRQIDLWGSAFVGETIRKSDAINFIKLAIPTVLGKRAARRVV